jgi:hypothetical protein
VADSNEKTDLEQLLSSPGWLRFLEHARQMWNLRLPDRLIAAAEQPHGDVEVKKVSYAAAEVNALVSWPKERLGFLTRPDDRNEFRAGRL